MVRMGTRSLISDSPPSREISSHQRTFIRTEIENANGVLLLAMRNLAATMSAAVARLDRLEGAHFDARNPADPGTVGSLAIQTPESLSSGRAAENSSLASQFLQWVDGESSKSIPPPSHPSPQTVVDFIDVPPCDTSVQKLFTSNALESDCGVLELENTNNSSSGGLVEQAPAHDENAVKIQTFLRLSAVRLRLRNDCGLENLRVLESQVLRSVSQWYSPVAFGSPATARHLAAARVIAGFVDRAVIKWLLVRRRSAQPIAARLVQKWFRGIRLTRLALNLFAPFFSSTSLWSNMMPSWCFYHVHIAWIQTGKNEWSQWVLSFKAKGIHTQEYHGILHPDAPPLSTTVRNMVMSKFGGCRKWPFHGKPSARTNLPYVNFSQCESLHTLVNPLWAASFWRTQNASYKNGVQLAHQNSHKSTIPTCLLRWSYGLEPEVSPPAKIDWRRGASRRRRRSNRASPVECLLSVNDTNEDDSGAEANNTDDYDARNDDSDVEDDINSATDDGSDSGHTFNQGDGHDDRCDDHSDVAHHDHHHHDKNIDDSEKYDGSAGDGHDDQYDPNDASYIDDQHDDNQYDDYDDRNDY